VKIIIVVMKRAFPLDIISKSGSSRDPTDILTIKVNFLSHKFVKTLQLVNAMTDSIIDVSYLIIFLMHRADIMKVMASDIIYECGVRRCKNIIVRNDTFFLLSGFVINCETCGSSEERGWDKVDKWILDNIKKTL
jgi:hypothetical protein